MMWLLWALSLPDERSPHREAGEAADLDAVRRMASGDGEALAALYDRHGRAVYSLALRVLGDVSAAEEIARTSSRRPGGSRRGTTPRAAPSSPGC